MAVKEEKIMANELDELDTSLVNEKGQVLVG